MSQCTIPVTAWKAEAAYTEARDGKQILLGWVVMRTLSDGTAETYQWGPNREDCWYPSQFAAERVAEKLRTERQEEVNRWRKQ